MKTNKFTLLVCAAFALFACKGLTPDQQRKADKFQCYVAALAPHCDGVLDASKVVEELYKGQTSLEQILGVLEVAQPEVLDLMVRLQGCDQPSVK